MTKVSIIIVNWNGLNYLRTCLDSVFHQTYKGFEVILVDNGSVDDSVNFVKSNFPLVKVILCEKNHGFAEGNNIGIREALKNSEVKYIACLNNDTEVDKNWLSELVKAMENDNKIGLCASKILYFDKRDKIDSAGDFYYRGSLKVGPRGHGQKDNGQYEKQEECLSACAAAALYRRQMLEQVKLFDNFFDHDYFAYIEDSDLGLRARLLGWKCFYAPKAIVFHRVSATTSRLSNRAKKYFSLKNRLFTMIKIYPFAWWLKVLRNPVSYQNENLTFSNKLFIFCKVFINILVNLPKIIKKRNIIQRQRKVSTDEMHLWSKRLSI